MKITKIKTARIGNSLVLRVCTDKGIDGYSQFENTKVEYIGSIVPFFESLIVGCDPTNVKDIMRRIRRNGAFKPWGAVVSCIEIACLDITGKEYGIPVHKLLGGKVRDAVRVYTGSYRTKESLRIEKETGEVKFTAYSKSGSPEELGESMLALRESEAGITMCKTAIGWHGRNFWENQGIYDYAFNTYSISGAYGGYSKGSLVTKKGLDACVDYVRRLRETVGDKIDFALDCGPGFAPSDALRLARELEPFHVMWLEDTIAGDYTPYTMAQVYRDITMKTSTPIHTGEQIYLKENFRELIEGQCVNVVGPDPLDVGGLMEMVFIAEYADLHGIGMAPHGVFDGVFGMAAEMHEAAAMPNNFIGFEFPGALPGFWYDIVTGLPDQLVVNGCMPVWDKPGLGVEFDIPKAEKYLSEADKDFFK